MTTTDAFWAVRNAEEFHRKMLAHGSAHAVAVSAKRLARARHDLNQAKRLRPEIRKIARQG